MYSDEKEDERGPQKLVYRTTTIKRKFKEFLTLQAHLEENVACKPHLKGIKTPTRWTNVSLTKSDAIVANQRRAMLEKYLQQLCYHPVIGFCHEVMVFMAYGEDGFCSFEVGDPKDLLTHRLDKVGKRQIFTYMQNLKISLGLLLTKHAFLLMTNAFFNHDLCSVGTKIHWRI